MARADALRLSAAGGAIALLLTACGYTPPDRAPAAPPPRASLPADPTPQPEPRSRYGNGPVYEVFGQRYEVLASSYGYQERGVASWYGKKFHGRPTSSREPYDMYAMTAAHKTLPLPTYVEVRNLSNNRRIVVKVNDRGPFVDNRIIDLSYAAALKLGMVRDGTSLVEVRAISFDAAPQGTRAETPQVVEERAPIAPRDKGASRVFVQAGAFGDRRNAARRHRLLRDNGIDTAFVHEESQGDSALYRVRVGPIDGVAQYDDVVNRLNAIGIADTHLVTD